MPWAKHRIKIVERPTLLNLLEEIEYFFMSNKSQWEKLCSRYKKNITAAENPAEVSVFSGGVVTV